MKAKTKKKFFIGGGILLFISIIVSFFIWKKRKNNNLSGIPDISFYRMNYDRIIKLLPKNGEDYRRIKSEGFMDLIVEKIGKNEYSLAHYYEQNGDLMRDPEMTVRIYPEVGLVEALSFQMDNPPIYQVVYPEPDKVYLKLKNELNRFLRMWLLNLKKQGFYK